MSFEQDMEKLVGDYMTSAGIPASEFSPAFAVKMIQAMMVSHRKYGYVAKAYPTKMDAMADIMTRRGSYRTHGNKWFLVDVANFAMIEAMHPRHPDSHWGENDAHNSPGRNEIESRRLVQKDNDDGRIGGDTFLHIPHDSER